MMSDETPAPGSLVRGLEEIIGMLDSILIQPDCDCTMEVSEPEPIIPESDNIGSSTRINSLSFGHLGLDDDGIRPKSFLHDEMDEFNQIFSELARPKQSKYRYLADNSNDSFSSSDTESSIHHAESDASISDCVPASCKQPIDAVDSMKPVEPLDVTAIFRDIIDMPLRRSSSLAETSDVPPVDCSSRLYGSLTSDRKYGSHGSSCLSKGTKTNQSPSVHTARPTWSFASDECLNEDDADSGYQSGNSTMVATATGNPLVPEMALCASELQRRISSFNNNSHGLTMRAEPNTNVFKGFIRVHMNLHKPINMALHPRPSSAFDMVNSGTGANSTTGMFDYEESTEIVSFYLPANTIRVIHITSEMTTPMVVQTLLNKFMISDPCSKFVLYERLNGSGGAQAERQLNGMMRKLDADERPLELCLRWSDEGVDSLDRHEFVLQDNVTSEIMWDAFSLPELEAFLRILDREEDSYITQIRLKYSCRKIDMERRMKEMQQKAADRQLT